jgi:hypothetical protein
MEKYGFMPGTHEENRSNPPVRSKFDKSQGKGLPAPHLSSPGKTAKVTGSSHSGHTENGHKLPTERSVGLGGGHLRHNYSAAEMGAPMLHGQGMGLAKNTRLSDGNVIKSSHRVDSPNHLAGHEPNPAHGGADKHTHQHSTGHANNKMGGGTDRKMGASRPQHQDNHSSRSKEGAGVLSGGKLR